MTLDQMIPNDLGEEVNVTAAYEEVRAALKARHAREAAAHPGGLVMRAFCRCGHHDMGTGQVGQMCHELTRLHDILDPVEWLRVAREIRDKATRDP
jgi:hypothetical protein